MPPAAGNCAIVGGTSSTQLKGMILRVQTLMSDPSIYSSESPEHGSRTMMWDCWAAAAQTSTSSMGTTVQLRYQVVEQCPR